MSAAPTRVEVARAGRLSMAGGDGSLPIAGGGPVLAAAWDGSAPHDTRGRPLLDLRISVTDRCSFRCDYCMPIEAFGQDAVFLPRSEILTFEEIVGVVEALLPLGLRKVRLTGGEPLLRRGLPELITQLRAAGPELDLALTTNGMRLAVMADELSAAGLDRVTVSLDSLDATRFAALSGVNADIGPVLEGLETAVAAGLGPLRINTVVRRGVNEEDVLPLVEHFRGTPHMVRFIEFMDVGTTNGWRLDDVLAAADVLATVGAVWPIEPVPDAAMGRVARRWRFIDGAGEVGVIASVSEPFCGGCTRARLSADGRLYTCLFAEEGLDLKGPLRMGLAGEEFSALVARRWLTREDHWSEVRGQATTARAPIEMSYIGG